jgi:hypothetical protein
MVIFGIVAGSRKFGDILAVGFGVPALVMGVAATGPSCAR